MSRLLVIRFGISTHCTTLFVWNKDHKKQQSNSLTQLDLNLIKPDHHRTSDGAVSQQKPSATLRSTPRCRPLGIVSGGIKTIRDEIHVTGTSLHCVTCAASLPSRNYQGPVTQGVSHQPLPTTLTFVLVNFITVLRQREHNHFRTYRER